uniref:Uncharacterized protein n=1 Tax=Triticum urartu TaxID=4572 RepID=A0A8R7QN11_TRIUA
GVLCALRSNIIGLVHPHPVEPRPQVGGLLPEPCALAGHAAVLGEHAVELHEEPLVGHPEPRRPRRQLVQPPLLPHPRPPRRLAVRHKPPRLPLVAVAAARRPTVVVHRVTPRRRPSDGGAAAIAAGVWSHHVRQRGQVVLPMRGARIVHLRQHEHAGAAGVARNAAGSAVALHAWEVCNYWWTFLFLSCVSCPDEWSGGSSGDAPLINRGKSGARSKVVAGVVT